jgi:hypothetical protein
MSSISAVAAAAAAAAAASDMSHCASWQVLSNLALSLHSEAVAQYNAKNATAFRALGQLFLSVINDVDALASTQAERLIGALWLVLFLNFFSSRFLLRWSCIGNIPFLCSCGGARCVPADQPLCTATLTRNAQGRPFSVAAPQHGTCCCACLVVDPPPPLSTSDIISFFLLYACALCTCTRLLDPSRSRVRRQQVIVGGRSCRRHAARQPFPA